MSRVDVAAAVAVEGRLELTTVSVGEPGPGEVRVRMAAAGVCHTDHDLLRSGQRMVLGHEGAGRIESVGPGVHDLAVGTPIVLTWAMACGECRACGCDLPHLCDAWSPVVAGEGAGGHAHLDSTTHEGAPIVRAFNLGTFSELAVVRREAAVPVPAALPMEQAAILGCGVMTGVGSVLNASPVDAGSVVAVLGCGGVGLNVVQGARLAGATVIVAVDPGATRLEMASRFGATHTVQPDPAAPFADTVAAVVAACGRLADVAFECTAVPALAVSVLDLVRNGGTAVAVSGVEQEIAVDMNLFEWDKTYLNPLYGKCRPERDFPRLVALHDRGELLLGEQITRTYGLAELAAAFDDLLAGRNAKGVVVFPEPDGEAGR